MCRVFCWVWFCSNVNVNVNFNGAGCSLVTAGPRPVWVCGGRREPFHGGSYQTSMFGKAPANPPRPVPPTRGRWPKGPSAGRGRPRSGTGRAKPGTSSSTVEPGLARLLLAFPCAPTHRRGRDGGGFAGALRNMDVSQEPPRTGSRRPPQTRTRRGRAVDSCSCAAVGAQAETHHMANYADIRQKAAACTT